MTRGESFSASHIGFPPPLLGSLPIRLPVLWNADGLIAIWKPVGIPMLSAGGRDALSLERAINVQARAGKGELARLGVDVVVPVIPLDPECSGIALFATSRAATDCWRNAYGSQKFCMRFDLLCRRSPDVPELTCDLPLAWAAKEGRAKVSHRYGKAAETRFRRVDGLGPISLWQAETRLHRRHQTRVHAFERGLGILGEDRYGATPPLYLSEIKRAYRKRGAELPLHDGICVHLKEVCWDGVRAGGGIVAPWPERMQVLWKQLERHSV